MCLSVSGRWDAITERYAPRSELDKLTPCYSFFNSVFMLDYCYLAKIFFKRHSAIEEAKKWIFIYVCHLYTYPFYNQDTLFLCLCFQCCYFHSKDKDNLLQILQTLILSPSNLYDERPKKSLINACPSSSSNSCYRTVRRPRKHQRFLHRNTCYPAQS